MIKMFELLHRNAFFFSPGAFDNGDHTSSKKRSGNRIKELNTSNEELKSSNEELKTSNEGLKTANEGLKTSNEELKTSNRKLTVSNTELNTSNKGLTNSNLQLIETNEELREARRAALNLLEDAVQSKEALLESEARLAKELAATKQLQEVSRIFIETENSHLLYERIMDAAKAIMRSDMASIQKFVPGKNVLELIGHKTFHPESAKFWELVTADSMSVCGIALAKNKRIVVPNVKTKFIKDEESLKAFQISGIRAVQSTPLISRFGRIVGMLSTHWCKVHEPSEDEFGLFDVLARQAADLIERKQAEDELINLNASLEHKVEERTKEIKEQAHFISHITETVPDMISVMDLPSQNFRFINKKTFLEQGFDPEVMAGLSEAERSELLIHEDDRSSLESYFNRFSGARDGEIITVEYRAKNFFGHWLWFLARGVVFLRDEAGKVTQVLHVIQNITERKVAEEKIARQTNLLTQAEEIAQAGSWEYDTKTKEFLWSDGMYRLFNIKKGEPVTPEIYLKYSSEKELPVAQKIVDGLQKNFEPFEEILRIRSNGSYRTLRIKAAPLRNEKDEVVKVLGVDMDITETERAEKKIGELNKSLFAMNKDLNVLNSELRNFNAIAANNYAETLRHVYINLETIVTTDARNLSNSSRANLRRAQAAIQKMKLLTNDINHYLELYDIAIKKELVDPNEILIYVKEKMQKKLEDANATINFAGLPRLMADQLLFSKLMINIIDNSIKFRKPGTDPFIDISYSLVAEMKANDKAKENTAYTIITVTDNGIGFNNEDAGKIFDLFTQLDEGKHKGSGIGLAICKKIMEMHGGFITAESEIDKGTSIRCYFPS